jgi:hypothetical protein
MEPAREIDIGAVLESRRIGPLIVGQLMAAKMRFQGF